MGKGSVAKLIAAFAIIAVYTFLFGIMGKIEGIETVIAAESPDPAEETDNHAPVVNPGVDENGRAVYTYVTELNVKSGKKPSLADYTHTQPIMVIPLEESTVATTTAPPDYYVADNEDFDYTTPSKTSAPETTAPTEATTKATTASLTTAATSIITTTAKDADAPTTVPPEDDAEESVDPEDDEDDDDNQPFTDLPDIEDEFEDYEESNAPEPDNSDNAVPESSETTLQAPALNETFTVNAEGKTMTGNALDIVACAVMAEIGDGFDDEAIKAQAIATYTYIKYYNDNNQKAYIVNRTPSERMKNLVSEVIGKAIYYNGSLIQAVYCASTAGYTASSKTVWGVDYPYLRSKQTSFDEIYDINFGRKPTFSAVEMKNYVKNATGIELTGDPSTWFTIESYVDNVYVGQMTIGGQKSFNNGSRNVTITGRVFRETIMKYDIRSSCFTIDYDADSDMFTITTYGYGHGVGLSQHGANILASHYGYDYEQILGYYYEGTTIA